MSDKSSPQVVRTPVTLLAVGSGGSGSYEFRFKFFNGTTWSLVGTHYDRNLDVRERCQVPIPLQWISEMPVYSKS